MKTPGAAYGQHVAADDLPPGGAHPVGGLAHALGHGPQRLHRHQDDDRQDQHRQRQPARDVAPTERVGAREGAQRLHEHHEPEDAVDDRRHAGEVADVGGEQPVEARVARVLLQVDRRGDPERASPPPRRSRSGSANRRCPGAPPLERAGGRHRWSRSHRASSRRPARPPTAPCPAGRSGSAGTGAGDRSSAPWKTRPRDIAPRSAEGELHAFRGPVRWGRSAAISSPSAPGGRSARTAGSTRASSRTAGARRDRGHRTG